MCLYIRMAHSSGVRRPKNAWGCEVQPLGPVAEKWLSEAMSRACSVAKSGSFRTMVSGHGWRVAAHGLVVSDNLRFDHGTEDSSDELARRPQLAGSGLHAEGAVRECLRNRHRAPLALAIGAELGDASSQGLQIARLEEVFHAAILAEHKEVVGEMETASGRSSARRWLYWSLVNFKPSGCISIAWTGRGMPS